MCDKQALENIEKGYGLVPLAHYQDLNDFGPAALARRQACRPAGLQAWHVNMLISHISSLYTHMQGLQTSTSSYTSPLFHTLPSLGRFTSSPSAIL